MPARLNHTIVWCSDQERSARFLTETLPTIETEGPASAAEAHGLALAKRLRDDGADTILAALASSTTAC